MNLTNRSSLLRPFGAARDAGFAAAPHHGRSSINIYLSMDMSAYLARPNVRFQHYPVAANPARSDRFQPVSAVARPNLNVRASLEHGLLRCSKGQRAG